MLKRPQIESFLVPTLTKFKVKKQPKFIQWLKRPKINSNIKNKIFKPLKFYSPRISHNILKIVKVDSGGMINSISFEFSSSDLVNNTLTRFHGLNTKNVDVTIIDDTGKEIGLTSTVSVSHVIIEMGRAVIPNGKKWTLLVEA